MGASTVASVGEGAALQKAWQRLPRTGKWEQAMQGWQDFAAAHAQSPLAAYAVWSLALFYADAGQQSAAPAKEAEILRGYSRELINGLARMQAAPGWLRSVAASSANHH